MTDEELVAELRRLAEVKGTHRAAALAWRIAEEAAEALENLMEENEWLASESDPG